MKPHLPYFLVLLKMSSCQGLSLLAPLAVPLDSESRVKGADGQDRLATFAPHQPVSLRQEFGDSLFPVRIMVTTRKKRSSFLEIGCTLREKLESSPVSRFEHLSNAGSYLVEMSEDCSREQLNLLIAEIKALGGQVEFDALAYPSTMEGHERSEQEGGEGEDAKPGPERARYDPKQWYIPEMNADDAWSELKRLRPRNVKVCVVDSGVDYNHPGFTDRLAVRKRGGKGGARGRSGPRPEADGGPPESSAQEDVLIAANFVDMSLDPMDTLGHGTHVAGVIAANPETCKVAGINPSARVIACKAFDEAVLARLSNIVRCIDFCLGSGAEVQNHSWVAAGRLKFLKRAFESAHRMGVVRVVGSGNYNTMKKAGLASAPQGPLSRPNLNIDETNQFPAAYSRVFPNVVATANLALLSRREWRSIFSSCMRRSGRECRSGQLALNANSLFGSGSVQIAAPGTRIYSLSPKGSYAFQTGTSTATAVVSGVVSLIKSLLPRPSSEGAFIASCVHAIQILRESVRVVPGLEGKVGWRGLPDCLSAVELTRGFVRRARSRAAQFKFTNRIVQV